MEETANTHQRLLKITAITFVLMYLARTIPSIVALLNLVFGIDLSMQQIGNVLALNVLFSLSVAYIIMIPLAIIVFRREHTNKTFAWVVSIGIVFMNKLGLIGYVLYKSLSLLTDPALTLRVEKQLSGYIVRLALIALVAHLALSFSVNIINFTFFTGLTSLHNAPVAIEAFAMGILRNTFQLIVLIPIGLLVKNYQHSQGRSGWAYFVMIIFGGYLGLLTYLVFAVLERIEPRPAKAA